MAARLDAYFTFMYFTQAPRRIGATAVPLAVQKRLAYSLTPGTRRRRPFRPSMMADA
jgi:hypothetical protein